MFCCIPWRLVLMLALTFASCIFTFVPCTCGVSLLSNGANIPLAQVLIVTSCNLCWWCFIIHPLLQIVHLHTWWYLSLQRVLVPISLSHWCKHCPFTWATCTVWSYVCYNYSTLSWVSCFYFTMQEGAVSKGEWNIKHVVQLSVIGSILRMLRRKVIHSPFEIHLSFIRFTANGVLVD